MNDQPMVFPVDSLPIGHYSEADIARLRERCNALLPSLSDLDLNQELVLQYIGAKALLKRANEDEDTPLNQVAQVVNSAAALLKQLAGVQIELHTAEKNRLQENALIDALKMFPELHEAFLKEYEIRLEAIG